ncbi:MAG: ABC transporter ATP-binding protein [Acidimicrobiia bacterium]|nr:ABC transporter ATP-binding protein [Acidimicrobiia bacterium]
MNAAPLIRLEGVGRRFRSGTIEVEALRDAHLEIKPGEYLSIVGPSGSGKSTLLNIIALLDRQTSGVYRFEGSVVTELSEGYRTGLRAHRIGFVFQSFHLLAHRTVTENVILSMLYNRLPPKERKPRARAALERVGLSHRADFRPDRLSGGERQRVAIARAIATGPAILICDEPTGNLDSASTESVLDLFDELRSDGLTLLVVTHDPAVSARAERTLQMHDGRLSEPS